MVFIYFLGPFLVHSKLLIQKQGLPYGHHKIKGAHQKSGEYNFGMVLPARLHRLVSSNPTLQKACCLIML